MSANCQQCHPILSLLLPGLSSTETLDPHQDSQLLVKRKDLRRTKTPQEKITKGMTSPAPTLNDESSTADSSGLKKQPPKKNEGDHVKRPLFQEEPPKQKKRPSKKKPEVDAPDVEPPKEPVVPEVEEPKPKRKAATKSKVQPKAPPVAGDTPEVHKPFEEDVKKAIKKQATTDSLGPAVQDALNRSGTNEHAEASETKEVEKEDGEKGKDGEDKVISKKQLKEKRDLVAHARKMRFYRSLSSLKLSM